MNVCSMVRVHSFLFAYPTFQNYVVEQLQSAALEVDVQLNRL